MNRRSLSSSADGILQAKQIIANRGWTQEDLANEVGLSSRQSIWKFLTGRPVKRQIFQEICFKLQLNWEEIANLSEDEYPIQTTEVTTENLGIESWVSMMRIQGRDYIKMQCNTLQSSFYLTQPSLNDIYVGANLLTQLSHQRWLEVSDFQNPDTNLRGFSLTEIQAQGVTGVDLVGKYNKLMILGQPGAGKTTFLKHLALQCSQGKYRRDVIPCFIELRSWLMETEHETANLWEYFHHQAKKCGLSSEQAIMLLQEGKGLFLLDGLDEVEQEEREILAKTISQFTQVYHKNQFIITSRPAAQLFHFQGFTYVEMAAFNRHQIEAFARQWFVATAKNKKEGKIKAQQFIEELEKSENQPLLELGITPILLNLMCSVFQERSSFPRKRAKLYQAGLDILLQRWDQARGIARDSLYKDLPVLDKIKLLCQIAAQTFEAKLFFFEVDYVLRIIENYLVNTLKLELDVETLWSTSESILNCLQLQHGLLIERAKNIYSFSHLTFQEYFTARKIVSSDLKTLENELDNLGTHIFDPRWQEVILLTASMLPKADFLLQSIKNQIDALVREDLNLQKFLIVLDDKVKSLQLNYQQAAVRAFYFTLFFHRDLNLAIALDIQFGTMNNLSRELQLDATLARCLMDSIALVKNPDIKKFINLYFSLALQDKFQLDPKFNEAFKQVKSQLPPLENETEVNLDWWKNNGKKWVDNFRDLLINYRHIGHDWQLTLEQEKRWQNYYNANLFLVECLQGDCQTNDQVKQAILSEILLK
ncbi:putative signal transduction protein with Nacht domain [Rippkaea orientalis PCC 8801]|uniref:Putative signal transduction protein with Nacht domain n=2 Tax=Rippkaea TaxID=2546365 RepID=B7JUI5_RIPO1|nr:putative signal transduction protein with Nacht domain [Rippkaea orientalis PCC 8801]